MEAYKGLIIAEDSLGGPKDEQKKIDLTLSQGIGNDSRWSEQPSQSL